MPSSLTGRLGLIVSLSNELPVLALWVLLDSVVAKSVYVYCLPFPHSAFQLNFVSFEFGPASLFNSSILF